ncbi:T9SS type A sorting domain-containing protein [Thalassobellus citreus]|uniref:T9SS type A sorting domain-containing protein n=1 Tax=Thalassobellus citreus TaxID=3367752 RepID=UPI0037B5D9B1
MNIKNSIFFWFCVFTPGIICSQIVNEGTLQIEPATTVYFENEYLNQLTGIHNNNGDLYLNNDFVNNGITSASSGTTFFKSSVNNVLNISGTRDSINFYNLEVNVYGASKKGVYVDDNLGVIVANKLNLESGDLRLVGESQLVQSHVGTNINTANTGSLLKDQQGISNVYGYNYWSSPVTNNLGFFSLNGGLFDGTDANLNPFSPQQVLFNTGSPYTGVPSVLDGSSNVTTPLYINDTWLYKFSQSSLEYYGWQKIDQNTLLDPGYGFTMKGTGAVNQNYVFKGVPNNGSLPFSILAGESVLLGNPYPSAIDSYKFIQDNLSVLDNIQFWVDGGSDSHYLADYQGGYSICNLTGGVAPSMIASISGVGSSSGVIPKRYIGVAQGFFVDANSSGNIIFDNSQRVFKEEDGVNSNFYKSTNQKNSNSNDVNKYIRIGYEDPEGFHRQLLLGFLPESPVDIGYNPGYDATISSIREDDLFYIIENDLNKKYVIEAVGEFNDSLEFPMGLVINQVGVHTIMLDAVENFNDTVYIKDSVLNKTYNLSNSSVDISLPPDNYFNRFSIVFKPDALLSINANIEDNVHVYVKENHIVINNKKLLKLRDVQIYNMLGQQIISLKKDVINTKQINIPFLQPQGMYLVIVNSNEGNKTFKITN